MLRTTYSPPEHGEVLRKKDESTSKTALTGRWTPVGKRKQQKAWRTVEKEPKQLPGTFELGSGCQAGSRQDKWRKCFCHWAQSTLSREEVKWVSD